MKDGEEKWAEEPPAVPEGAFVVNEDYREEPPAPKARKKVTEPVKIAEPVAGNPVAGNPVEVPDDPITTIDKYVEQYHSDLLPVHKAGIIGHHAGKILHHSEWKAILLDELTRRV
jgi:hypothetical protein